MEILKPNDCPTVKKESGTEIIYHLFNEYEVNVNTIPPESFQDWHFHKRKEEVVLIMDGDINIEWISDDEVNSAKLSSGDLVRLEDTPHRFVNSYGMPCKFVCFKLVLSGESQRDILAGDKFEFSPNE